MIDRQRIEDLIRRENARFETSRPRSAALLAEAADSMPSGVPMAWMRGLIHHAPVYVDSGEGAAFTDVDGHRYIDFNQADLSSSAGYGTPAIVESVSRRMARGAQFLLPVEDAIRVSEELAARFGLSHWQYTLSASSAATEAIRLARLASGREGILMFDGSYHGHDGETLVDYAHERPRTRALGLAGDHARHTTVVPFNDIEAAERKLASGRIACVMVEPALTNVGLVLPRRGFLQELRDACDRHGALMIADETHTHMFAFGGLVRLWKLRPHVVVVGKNIAGGVPIGAYGFGADLARLMDERLFDHTGDSDGFASGGTLYGNALSLAAARTTLETVFTEDAYRRTSRLGARLASGIQEIVDGAGLPWRAQRLESRANWLYGTVEPRNGAEAAGLMDVALSDSRRIFMANRNVWEAISTAGPCASFAMTEPDIDRYLDVAADWIREIAGTRGRPAGAPGGAAPAAAQDPSNRTSA